MDYFLSLHKKFIQLGRQKFKLTNELLAILPEIYNSGIYKKYASSIFEYAAKFGGLSNSSVEKRLRIEKHLKDKPKLREAIKEVGINKVSMVATLATPETEEAFVDKIKNMSKSAVQTLSKEMRQKSAVQTLSKELRQKSEHAGLSCEMVCEAKPQTIKLELNNEMTFLFLKLKKKWNLTNKEVLAKILTQAIEKEFPGHTMGRNADLSIHESVTDDDLPDHKSVTDDDLPTHKSVTGDDSTKEEKYCKTVLCKKQPTCYVPAHRRREARYVPAHKKQPARYIPAHRRREALGNGKCKYPACNKPAEVIHHKDRYSQSKNHDSIIPLCREHHEFMHNGLIKNEKAQSNKWQIDITGQVKSQADILYRKYRHEAPISTENTGRRR